MSTTKNKIDAHDYRLLQQNMHKIMIFIDIFKDSVNDIRIIYEN